MTARSLLWLCAAAAALALGSVAATVFAPLPVTGSRDALEAKIDSLRVELDESRTAFNNMFMRLGAVEERCVFRRPRSSTRSRAR